MHRQSIPPFVTGLLLLFVASTVRAQTINFTTTQVPNSIVFGDTEKRGGTSITGLNDSGQFVGTFGERNWVIWNTPHAFIYNSADNGFGITGIGSESRSPEGYRIGWIQGDRYVDPGYRYFDLAPAPGLSDFNDRVSTPKAINNAGVVVGGLSSDWLDRAPSQAFRYDTVTRQFDLLAVPGALSSTATDINASGQIVGNFTDATGDHGFLYSAGAFTVIDMPGEIGHTRIGGINDAGTIVGSAYDYGNANSFIYRNGSFTNFTADSLYTVAADINNSEQIVGWVGVSGKRRGFLYQSGTSTILDFNGEGNAGSTYAHTINNLGVIGGVIENRSDGAFLATVTAVPEPATSALWLAGGFGVFVAARRNRAALGSSALS